MDTKSGETEQFTDDAADIFDFAVTENGATIVYQTDAARDDILAEEWELTRKGILVDDTARIIPPITASRPVFGRLTMERYWGRSAEPTRGHVLSNRPPSYRTISTIDRRVRVATGQDVELLTKGPPDWLASAPQANSSVEAWAPLVSPGAERAAVVLNKKDDSPLGMKSQALAVISRGDASDPLECTDPRCKAEWVFLVRWSDDSPSIYFITHKTVSIAASLHAWNVDTGAVTTLLESEGLIGANETKGHIPAPCPFIDGHLICTQADGENPPRLMAISLTDHAANVFHDPNAALRRRFTLNTEVISWPDKYGRKLTGVLVYPRNFQAGRRYPLVLTSYVCDGFLDGGLADTGPEYPLAEHGIMALCMPSGATPEFLAEQYPGSGGQAPMMSFQAQFEGAVDSLVERGLVDPKRVGLTGFSYSGRGANYTLTHSDKFAAAALPHLYVAEPGAEKMNRPGSEQRTSYYRTYGLDDDEAKRRAFYEDMAVSLRADRVTVPILLQAKEHEFVLNDLDAFAALEEHGRPIEAYIFPHETHLLYQPIHRFWNFSRQLDWFRFWLKGEEDPDPAKADQYARWRKMRAQRCAWDEPAEKKPVYCDSNSAIASQ